MGFAREVPDRVILSIGQILEIETPEEFLHRNTGDANNSYAGDDTLSGPSEISNGMIPVILKVENNVFTLTVPCCDRPPIFGRLKSADVRLDRRATHQLLRIPCACLTNESVIFLF